jgi:hypothetical protein
MINTKESDMETKDLNKIIVTLAERAITSREVMDFMREKEELKAYDEWSVRWTVLTDVLALLTGKDTTECMTRRDFQNIIKEYSDEG